MKLIQETYRNKKLVSKRIAYKNTPEKVIKYLDNLHEFIKSEGLEVESYSKSWMKMSYTEWWGSFVLLYVTA